MKTIRRWLAALLLCFTAQGGNAAEPPKDPILRIETGRHTATIYRVATDADGRRLVTASNDKTLRVWDLPDGKLVRTIRPPIGEGYEGRLFSVALSPEGGTVACGGWTQFNDGRTSASADGFAIYLFDRAGGKLLARIAGLPGVVNHLAFSPDGRFLAASLGEKNGVRLYRTGDWSQAGQDRDYGGAGYSAHFSRDGRLVTTCEDGYLRMYETKGGGLHRIALAKAPGGDDPYAARFSPDGGRVAVGYEDTTNVSVLSGRDLSEVFSAETRDLPNGNLRSVAWSADGSRLFAGGEYLIPSDGVLRNAIRSWGDAGKGSHTDTVAADNTIFDLAPLSDGGIAYGASGPAFGLVGRTGSRTLLVPTDTADHRNIRDNFRVSRDGGTVSFGYEAFGRSPATFDIVTRSLAVDGTTASLRPPLTTGENLVVEGWKNSQEPKLNGTPLELARHEISRALGVAEDGGSFVLGSSWYLRRFDRYGDLLWAVPAPGTATAVNVAGNGSVMLAAYVDGTIRWYRMSDGKELLAFFPHADRKRWVLWTPSGYYDASPGGEELIGWHVNNGRDGAADFFPASRFRADYFRPEIVARMLSTLDEGEALRLANAAAETKQASAPPRPSVRIFPPAAYAPPNGAGRSGQERGFAIQPRLYVLSVGVSAYSDPGLTLRYAAKDAEDLAASLSRQKETLYRDVQTMVLTDARATRDGIMDGMDWLTRQVTAKDVGIIFLAGHGVSDPWGVFYYLPHNADTDKLRRTGIALSDIKNAVSSLAGKAVLFVDTCHSGNLTGGRRGASDINAEVGDLSGAEHGAVVFASSTERQNSLEEDKWGNGAFTKALVEGISGKADYGGKGRITINMLDLYLSERVKQLTKGKQTPMTSKPRGILDFAIAVVR